MYCKKCGREIEDTAKFCKYCGVPIEKAGESMESPDVPPQLEAAPDDMSDNIPSPDAEVEQTTVEAVPKDSKKMVLIIVFAAIAILALVAILAANKSNKTTTVEWISISGDIPSPEYLDSVPTFYLGEIKPGIDILIADDWANEFYRAYGGQHIRIANVPISGVELDSNRKYITAGEFEFELYGGDIPSITKGKQYVISGVLTDPEHANRDNTVVYLNSCMVAEDTGEAWWAQENTETNHPPAPASSAVFKSGIFGTNPCVELTVSGNYVSYSVNMEFSGGQLVGIEGTAPLSNEISFMGNDGWDNIVEGKIYYIDDDIIAVESETVEEAEYGLGYSLDLEYTQLKRQEEKLAFYPESAYDGMPTFSDLKLSSIYASDFCTAYEGKRVRIYGLTFDDGTYDTNSRALVDDGHCVVLADLKIDDYMSFGSAVVVEGTVVGAVDYGDFEALCLDDTIVNLYLTDYWVDDDYGTDPGGSEEIRYGDFTEVNLSRVGQNPSRFEYEHNLGEPMMIYAKINVINDEYVMVSNVDTENDYATACCTYINGDIAESGIFDFNIGDGAWIYGYFSYGQDFYGYGDLVLTDCVFLHAKQ